ncbi:hypothetical protein SAMN05444157_2114 [Frankineae bacterium MT45]|nr:hypothetical protein SAMN05444157_2114 [Frankineae bacterium MT45]
MTAEPVRTCVGCRSRSETAGLLRVVAVPASASSAESSVGHLVVVDPRHRLPGRGAWVHPSTECVALADQRRAFGRALRLSGIVDCTAVHEYVDSSGPGGVTELPAGGQR